MITFITLNGQFITRSLFVLCIKLQACVHSDVKHRSPACSASPCAHHLHHSCTPTAQQAGHSRSMHQQIKSHEKCKLTCCKSRVSIPSNRILPLLTSYRRMSSLRMVDLPLPLGPTRAMLCPGSTLRLTPPTTSRSPVYPKCTSCTARPNCYCCCCLQTAVAAACKLLLLLPANCCCCCCCLKAV